ncbi:MAG: NAD(+)/NADH kinase [Christensenellales bacterium]
MRIGIVANIHIDKSLGAFQHLKELLQGEARSFLPESLDELNDKTGASCEFFSSIDVVVVLGGDGTILSVARVAAVYDVPILGVNLGQIGFLSEVETDNLAYAARRLLEGEYSYDSRFLLRAQHGDRSFLAVNEVAVVRKQFSRIISAQIQINGSYYQTVCGDGVIVATPTGSTAYSLSAGGPLLCPDVDCVVVTPACSHTLSVRPLVVSRDSKIEISVDIRRGKEAYVAFDGQRGCRIDGPVSICCAQERAKFIRLKEYDFFALMQGKLPE